MIIALLIILIITVIWCTGKIVQYLGEIWTETAKVRVLLEVVFKKGDRS